MRKLLLSLATGAVLLTGAGFAQAQTTTTTTVWTTDQGTMMREYATTSKHTGFNDTAMVPKEGMVLPSTVTVYELPSTMKMPAGQYSYAMINNQPVVVETTTRKVVHTWGPNGTGGGG
jgi:hypothetical protein